MNNIREQIKDKKKIVVKIGSSSLQHSETGDLDYIRLEKLVRELCDISNQGKEVVLVTSGAIAVGKKAVNLKTIEGQTQAEAMAVKQACSAIGQARLMMAYQKLFSEYNHVAAQILMTKNTIVDNLNRYNAHNTFTQLLKMGVIPIVNENDTISVTELMFTDNDELSGLIATMMDVQALIILSNVDGIYNGKPGEPGVEVIREVDPDKDLSEYIRTEKSGFGRGGMMTKCNIARKVADEGITVMIANGKREHVLTDLIFQPDTLVFTRFIPRSNGVSSVKKWIAHSSGFAKGQIYLNAKAVEAVCGDRAVSLLPVGVTRVEGDFEKDDLVRIMSPEGKELGVGRTAYGSDEARMLIGHHDCKPIVHYDYLYLE